MSGCTLQRPDPAASSAGSRPESAASQRGAARSGAGRRGGSPQAPTLRCPRGDTGTAAPARRFPSDTPAPRRTRIPRRPPEQSLARGERGPIGFTPGCRCDLGPWCAPVMLSTRPLDSFRQPRGGGAGPAGGGSGSRLGFGGHSCLLLSTKSLLPTAHFYAWPRKAALGHPPPLQLLCALGAVHSPPSRSPMTSHLHRRSLLVGKAGRRS